MSDVEIFMADDDGCCKIKVVGRATFAVGPSLRKIVEDIDASADTEEVIIDLTECTGMDSTFMGILAMLALKVRKKNLSVKLINAGRNRKLLDGLGLGKLFNYVEEENTGGEWRKADTSRKSREDDAQTVLDAHKVLMQENEENVKKFKKVVEMVEKEIEK